MNQLKDRILEISKKLKLAHIGSNLSCLPLLEEIYAKKDPHDIVILDNAHAHLAHLVVMYGNAESEYSKLNEKDIKHDIKEYGIHCDRKAGCDASGGSLGHGVGIGIGYALADPKRDVYITVSDGSMMEGANWEALRIANDLRLSNIHIYCNFNGYTAVAKRDTKELGENMKYIAPWIDIQVRDTDNTVEFDSVAGHYKVLE